MTSTTPDQDNASLEAQLNEAVEHHRAGKLFEAEEIYRRILAVNPDYPFALCLLGAIAHAAGENEQAVDLIAQAIAIKPDYTDAYINLGSVLLVMDRFEEALGEIEKALALDPESAEAHSNSGVALMKLDRPDEATASYRKATEIRPDYAEAHFNLGKALNDMNRPEDALASYRQATSCKPDYAEAHHNIGNVLRDQDQSDDAIASYRRAIEIKPDYAEAHHNLGFALLGMGKQRDGLEGYEWRWQVPTCSSPQPAFQKPLWNGSDDLDDLTILLWPEQGPQDVSTWVSGIPEIIGRAGRCIVEVYPKLVSLYARSFPEAEVRGDSTSLKAPPVEDFDVHLPLGSLFRHLQQDLMEPCDAFLIPDPERVAFWKQRLAALGPGPYVGISWKSPMVTPARSPNYTRIDEWGPLFAQPAQFVNLQCGDDHDDRSRAKEIFGATVHHFDDLDLFDDLDDVAALTAALDVVITVSTAVSAIAAGVGAPVWLIAWRQSPWNNFLLAPRGPDVTSFERNTDEPWDDVFAALTERLGDLAAGPKAL